MDSLSTGKMTATRSSLLARELIRSGEEQPEVHITFVPEILDKKEYGLKGSYRTIQPL